MSVANLQSIFTDRLFLLQINGDKMKQDHKQNVIELRELINNDNSIGECNKSVMESRYGNYISYVYFVNAGGRIGDLSED